MANFITVIRSILVFVVIIILFAGKDSNIAYVAAFLLTILVITMDGLDGYIARKYNTASKFGAVLDIIGDRIVENIFWVTYLALGWVSLWIPLVVLTRGIIVDGIRSVALEQGYTAFGKTTMMKSSIGKFLVASNFSRGAYAAFKGIAFSTIIIANLPAWEPCLFKTIVYYFAYISVYITVFFCVIRGLPVIIESKYLFSDTSSKDSKQSEQKNIQNNHTNNQKQSKEEVSSLS
ncbi:MAG: CDP-alcohol phosphatidyltransferase family protein [Cyanobacteriota bacterium]